MREFQEKRKLRRFLYSKKTLFLLFFVLAFLVFSTVKVYLKTRSALSKSEETEKELTELKKRKAELEKDVERLQTESGVEEEVRQKLDVQKPGEKVAVIIEKNQENDKMNSEEGRGNFFSKFWQWVKGIF